MIRRRTIGRLALTLPWLAGCASQPSDWAPSAGQVVDARSRRPLAAHEWQLRVQAAQYLLLGELHDNPHHHRQRGDWITRLPVGTPVVLEHLDAGARLRPPVGSDEAMLGALVNQGFDAKAWRWPLHAPLMQAAARQDQVLLGGNLPRAEARRIAREGHAALPPALRELLDAAPLSAQAQADLDEDLRAGHCQQLPASRLPAMRWAQRGRDAAMARVLQSARRAYPDRQAVLLCGNGHVRRDYGVAQLLAHLEPGAAALSVGCVEAWPGDAPRAFDVLWIGPPTARDDPCLAMTQPMLR